MPLRFDGFYRSGLIRSVDWHAGVEMVEQCYDYVRFFSDGFWLRKSSATPELDFPAYLARVMPAALLEGMEGKHPMGDDGDVLHETGTFRTAGKSVELTIRRRELPDAVWSMQMLAADVLLGPGGDHYEFHPFELSATL